MRDFIHLTSGPERSRLHHRQRLPRAHGGPQGRLPEELQEHGGAAGEAAQEVQHGARPHQAKRRDGGQEVLQHCRQGKLKVRWKFLVICICICICICIWIFI